MKKNLFIPALAALSFAACTTPDIVPDEIVGGNESDVVTIVGANAASDVTKTVIGEPSNGKYPLYWCENDAIQINGETSSSIEFNPAAAASAQFTIPAELSYPYSAVYPASAVKSYAESVYTITLPAVQHYTEGSFDSAAAVMLGYATEGDVDFKNAMAFLKIKIVDGTDADAIKFVRVRANEDMEGTGGKYGRENMSGDFTANITADELALVPGTSAAQSVTLDCGEGVEQGKDLIIAIPAQKYTKGLKLFIVDVNNHYQEITSTKAFEPAAGSLYPTTIAFNGGGTYVGAGIYTANDWNTLAVQCSIFGDCAELKDAEGVFNVYEDIEADKLQRFGGTSEPNPVLVFQGKINGNGHIVTSSSSVPFFSYVSGEIKNITFAGEKSELGTWGTTQIALDLYEGALIENVTADFTVNAVPTADANTMYYGMFRNVNAGATIKNCEQKSVFTVNYTGVTTKDLYVLPYAYSNSGTIADCKNTGSIEVKQDTGQKTVVANVYSNKALISKFVNLCDITVNASNGAAVAGVAVLGGGRFDGCVNGEAGTAKGKITVTTDSAAGKNYHVAGIAAYGDADVSNCGVFLRCENYGDITLAKTSAQHIYRSAVAGIVSDIRYGAYGSLKDSFDNVYTTVDLCKNAGHLTIHESNDAASSSATPVFLGGIVGVSLNSTTAALTNGALVLTKQTPDLNGNYIVIRKDNENTGILELASANGQSASATASGARLAYVGGIIGFAYGMGRTNDSGTSDAHYAVIRGKQNGIIKVGSSVTGCTAAGGLCGGCCYAKFEQASVNVTYEKTALKTKNADAKYRGSLGAVVGHVVKYSDVTGVIAATLTDNTGLPAYVASGNDMSGLVGYAGITGATSVHRTTTKETHKLTIKTGCTYNGTAITSDNIGSLCYGGGNKAVVN